MDKIQSACSSTLYFGALSMGLWALLSTDSTADGWRPLSSDGSSLATYEPSAVCQLNDQRLILVQDEADDPLVLMRLNQLGEVVDIERPTAIDRRNPELGRRKPPTSLAYLEGLATLGGYLYAITSHSRTENGKRKKSSERLVRLRIKDREIGTIANYKSGITSYEIEID